LRNIKASNGKRSNDRLLWRLQRTVIYESIFVLLDRGPPCAARSRAAMRLANALDCHLQRVAQTGLVGLPVKALATGIRADVAARWPKSRRAKSSAPWTASAKNAAQQASRLLTRLRRSRAALSVTSG